MGARKPAATLETLRELRGQAHLEHVGSLKRLRAFYAGGWRDMPVVGACAWWGDRGVQVAQFGVHAGAEEGRRAGEDDLTPSFRRSYLSLEF